jgi:hypothetical protein
MRLEEIKLQTILEGSLDPDGFPTKDEVTETEIAASELEVKVSDRIAGEHEGWRVALKLAVDIDDYQSAFVADSEGRSVRPQKLIYNGVTYIIRNPVKNLKTHEMELLCEEVEGWQSLPATSPPTS